MSVPENIFIPDQKPASLDLTSKLFPQYWGHYAMPDVSEEGLRAVEQSRKDFKKNPPDVKSIPYWGDRRFRQEFVAQSFRSYLGGKVLDVGCDEAGLRKYIGEGYFGIDRRGNFDKFVDLDSGVLPFDDNSFDSVVCTDVIEHIEGVYKLFDEIMRVTRRYAIFSFPNCWWSRLADFKSGVDRSRSYGLPPEPASDRHRWFFNATEAEDFAAYRAAKNKARVLFHQHFYYRGDILRFRFRLAGKNLNYPDNYPAPDGVNTWRRRVLRAYYSPFVALENVIRGTQRIFFSPEKFRNRYAHAVWVVIEKTAPNS